jgi:hypothetical protein
MKVVDVHQDLRQLSYRLVKVRSYGRYDVNGFWFCSNEFEDLQPLAAATNTKVVMGAIDVDVQKTKYYGIINKILEFNFTWNKELKVVFFDCDWFDNNCGTQQNQFGMVEVKHNEWLQGYDSFVLAHQVEQVYYLHVWWVVHKVNPHEWLYTPGDARYHDTPALDGEVDELYQEEELSTYFVVKPGLGLNDLFGDIDDIQTPEKHKRKPIKKKVWWSRLRSGVQDRDAHEFWN